MDTITDLQLVNLFNISYENCKKITKNTPNKELIFIEFYKNYILVMNRFKEKISILSRSKSENEKSTRNKMIETRKQIRKAITERKKEVDRILTALGDKNISSILVKKSKNNKNLTKNVANEIQIQYNANKLNKNNAYLLPPKQSELNMLRGEETLTNLEAKRLEELETLYNNEELYRLQRNINNEAKATRGFSL